MTTPITAGGPLSGIAVNDGPTTRIFVANDTNPGAMSMVLVERRQKRLGLPALSQAAARVA